MEIFVRPRVRPLLLFLCAFLVQFAWWGQGIAQESQTVTLSIEVTGAQNAKGWSVALSFNPDQASYVSNSFQPSSFMPGLVPLVLEKEASVEVGGAILGADSVSGTGIVGQLQFILSAPPNTVEIAVIEYMRSVAKTEATSGSPFNLLYPFRIQHQRGTLQMTVR